MTIRIESRGPRLDDRCVEQDTRAVTHLAPAGRSRRRTHAFALLALALVACAADQNASDVEETTPGATNTDRPSGLAGTSSSSGGPETAPGKPGQEAPLPPCDDKETAALQTTLDGSHDVKRTDVVLSIKTACGIRFFSSGPSKLPATTLHRIASITKTHLASVVLELYADGLLSLSDPVSKWFANVPGGDAIHVEHLLWQTSGLAAYEESLSFQAGAAARRKWERSELIDFSFKARTKFAPGTSWEYVNVNYVMLGVIAEKASGKTLATLLRERIFQPLGMTATFSDGDEPFTGDLAVGRSIEGRDVSNSVEPSTFWGAGHLVGTPGDVVTWIEKRGNGEFHDAKVAPEFKKLIAWKPARPGWKYGPGTIELDGTVTSGGGPGYGHGGDLPGYHSMAFYFPDKRTTVVMINDSDGVTGDAFRRPFFDTLKTLFGGK